jgi:hypothetical protein
MQTYSTFTVTLESYEDGSVKRVQVNTTDAAMAMAIAEMANTDCVAVEVE